MHMRAAPIEFSSHFIPFFMFNFEFFAKWTVTSYLINVHRLIIHSINLKLNFFFLIVSLGRSLDRTVPFCFILYDFFVADFFDDPHSVNEWNQFYCSYFGIGLRTEDRDNEMWAKSHHHSIHLINKRSFWFWCFCIFVNTEHWKKNISLDYFPPFFKLQQWKSFVPCEYDQEHFHKCYPMLSSLWPAYLPSYLKPTLLHIVSKNFTFLCRI